MRARLLILCTALAGGLAAGGAGGAQIPALLDVPAAVPDPPRAELTRARGALAGRLGGIKEKVRAFNSACASVEKGSAAAASCRSRQGALQASIQAYAADAEAFNARVRAEAELIRLNERIARTRREIEAYSRQFKGYQESLREWTELPLKAREEAVHALQDLTATILLERLAHQKAKALSREAKLRLSSNRFWEKQKGATLAAMARAQKEFWDKIRAARTEAQVVAALSALKDGLGAIPALGPKDRGEALVFILKSASVINSTTIRNPVIALVISGGEFVSAAAYARRAGAEARERIDQLLLVGEARLKGLNALSKLYEADIQRRNALMRQRTQPPAK